MHNFFHRPRYQAADDYSAHNLITGHGCTTGKGVKEKSVVLSEDDTCQWKRMQLHHKTEYQYTVFYNVSQ